MTIKRLTALNALAAALLAAMPVVASAADMSPVATSAASPLAGSLAAFDPAAQLAQSVALDPASILPAATPAKPSIASTPADATAAVNAAGEDLSDLRKTLISLAMNLRDIRYVRGGHDPSTGFDCSGFVRYVFAHAIGLNLPSNSASQFLAGLKVNRDNLKPGDLVFFRTAGRNGHGRISHVGIYVADGRFIHSPSHGHTVRVDSLDEAYWAKRFAGAKRPVGMLAQNG